MNHKLALFFAIEKSLSYEEHLQETIALTHTVRLHAAHRRRLPLGSLVLKQLKFFALRVWFLQGMILAVLCTLLIQLYDIGALHSTEIPEWGERSLSKFLGLCGGVIVMSAIPLLLRSTRYKMMELERSTYFSARCNLLTQLVFIGIGDVGMLVVLALCAGRFRLTYGTIFLSLVIPYLTAAVSCVMLWTRTSPSFFRNAGVILCIASSYLVCELVERSRMLLPNVQTLLWIVYVAACIGVLYHECRNIFFQAEKGAWISI